MRNGFKDVKTVLSPIADPYVYKPLDAVIIIMAFDTFWAVPYFYIAYRLKSMGKKYVFYTTIEGFPIRYQNDGWIYRELEFVPNSEFTAECLRTAGARVKDVIYHGIDVDSVYGFRFRRDAVRRKLGLKDDDFMVLYIAGDYMRKGHAEFSAVIKEVSERDKTIKFVVLTKGDAVEYYSGLSNCWVIPGFGTLSEADIYGLYHACDLYAQASLSEGFGMPVLEALAAGKPVVHADYAPLTEITSKDTSFRVSVKGKSYVKDVGGIMYILHHYDPKEFADAIIHAKDEVVKNRDEFEAKCVSRARRFSVWEIYKSFIRELEDG